MPANDNNVHANDVSGKARTIVYIHGLGNKPPADVLKCMWDRALFGYDLGERSRMAYWVNRERYPVPEAGDCKQSDYSDGSSEAASDSAYGLQSFGTMAGETNLTPKQKAILEGIEKAMRGSGDTREAGTITPAFLPLPKGAREWVVRRISKKSLPDLYDLFFVAERRELMRKCLEERLTSGGGPFVIIAHSQGSIIAYDVLARLSKTDSPPDVRLLVTIGSPLGIKEVQDQLKEMTGQKKLHVPPCVARWVNVSDPLDPVAIDHYLKADYSQSKPSSVKVEDDVVFNADSPKHPHSGTGYLRLSNVRIPVDAAVETGLFQSVSTFTVARDVAARIEASTAEERHEVLIELVDNDLATVHAKLAQALQRVVVDPKAADIQPLKRFVAARLTRSEVEKVAAELGAFGGEARLVEKLWLNSVKRTLINSSIHTIQALPAQEAYHACGEGVAWAVLDTGVAANHPHFGAGKGSTIIAEHDCTTGAKMRSGPGMAPDLIGHGTHVAGIIAGGIGLVHDDKGVVHPMKGMAPRCKLHIYKVLSDDGTGRDSSIIRALDHIAEINEKAGKLVIHGVNLSLGGPFDPATYGCGYSPLCRELGRLWRQGVLVVVAAGNEGLQSFETLQGQVNASMDLSINDPANLEDCIAVGSVNKLSPHSYGVSYFSSRGPTADGRCKPDVVAPGEKILSCRHQFPAPPKKGTPRLETFYVEMSGTSMAAPHVSGILAAFLSKRSEFRGQPDRVKQILMDNCTDLKRERTFQGAGLPNLVKMLVAT